jgi:ribosomal protein S28E/S33
MTDAATEDFQNGEISAQEYADRLAEIPGEAERAAAGVNSSLDTIPREIVTVHRIEEVGAAAATGTTDAAARAAKGGGQKEPKKRAIGGPVQAGDVYTVGETGRELFVPGQDGRIVPNRMTEDILSGMQGATAPMASGGGGTGSITINISNPVVDNAARLQEMAGMIGSKVQSAVWGQFGAALDDLAAQGVP